MFTIRRLDGEELKTLCAHHPRLDTLNSGYPLHLRVTASGIAFKVDGRAYIVNIQKCYRILFFIVG